MNKLLLTLIVFQCTFSLLGQEKSDCSWVDRLEQSKEIGAQLELIQENYESCILVIANGRPVSSDSSQAYYGYVELFIKAMRASEIDSIYILRKEAARKLYGPYWGNAAVITFKNDQIIDRIRKRIDKKRKNKN